MATQMDNLARKQIYIPAARPQEELALRVAAYCRVSSDSEDQLNSFAAQTTHYHQLIANQGIRAFRRESSCPCPRRGGTNR